MAKRIFFTNDEYDTKAVKVAVVTDRHASGVVKAFKVESRGRADIIGFKTKDPYNATMKVFLVEDEYED